jgi:DNA-binding response OmpR family regulator
MIIFYAADSNFQRKTAFAVASQEVLIRTRQSFLEALFFPRGERRLTVNAWNVLLVDDEEEFVSTLAERLHLRGIDVRTALSIDQAFTAIESRAPGIIVLDLTLEEPSGMEMIRRLRTEFPDIGVIGMTALGRAKDVQESLRLGARYCLMKPFQIDELLEVLDDAVRNPY